MSDGKCGLSGHGRLEGLRLARFDFDLFGSVTGRVWPGSYSSALRAARPRRSRTRWLPDQNLHGRPRGSEFWRCCGGTVASGIFRAVVDCRKVS